MYELYTLLAWPIFVIGIGVGAARADWALIRCVGVTALTQLAFDLYGRNFAMPDVWAGQPSLAYGIFYLVAAIALTIRPSGKLCSIMAAIPIWGIVISALHFVFDWTKATDALYMNGSLALGFASFAIIGGGIAGDGGRRFCLSAYRRCARLANKARHGGLA